MKFFAIVLSMVCVAQCQMNGMPDQQPLSQPQAAQQMEPTAEQNARTQQEQQQQQIIVVQKNPQKQDKVQAFVIQRPQQQQQQQQQLLQLNAPGVNLAVGQQRPPQQVVLLGQQQAQPIQVVEEVMVKPSGQMKQEIIIEEEPNKVLVSPVRHCEIRLPFTSLLQRKGVCTSIPRFFQCIGDGGILAPSLGENGCGFAQACCIKNILSQQ